MGVLDDGKAHARVLIGSFHGASSPVSQYSETLYVDVTLPAGGEIEIPADAEERAIYVAEGAVEIAGDTFRRGPAAGLPARRPDRGALVRSGASFMLFGGASMVRGAISGGISSPRRANASSRRRRSGRAAGSTSSQATRRNSSRCPAEASRRLNRPSTLFVFHELTAFLGGEITGFRYTLSTTGMVDMHIANTLKTAVACALLGAVAVTATVPPAHAQPKYDTQDSPSISPTGPPANSATLRERLRDHGRSGSPPQYDRHEFTAEIGGGIAAHVSTQRRTGSGRARIAADAAHGHPHRLRRLKRKRSDCHCQSPSRPSMTAG